MSVQRSTRPLYQLAALHGVQTAYWDVGRKRRPAAPEAILAVLRAMGAPIETVKDAPAALREYRQSRWTRGVEPVVVAWNGGPCQLELCVAEDMSDRSVHCELALEGGEIKRWRTDLGRLPTSQGADVEGVRYVCKAFTMAERLPHGYHRLRVDTGRQCFETLVISAPVKAYGEVDGTRNRVWGLFAPLYSLHSRRSWGGGDFADLRALVEWVAGIGGNVVATLPLLATFIEGPSEPSPYAPVSRLAWNEFYLDVDQVPELSQCLAAQRLRQSVGVVRELDSLRQLRLVEYPRQMALKRRILEELCQFCFREASRRLEALQDFTRANETVDDYARFRATCERIGANWTDWPARLRDGTLVPGDFDGGSWRYHLYAQWLAQEQVGAVAADCRNQGSMLCLDFPLGVHPCGYDVWRNQGLFVPDMSAGAPPDAVFTRGQDWEFPPLHPAGLREQGYQYYIACLRHHMKFASVLRIDHVMGLHRLFWIPSGMDAGRGVYVRYPVEELYAIMTLESQRHGTILAGEDLGTVPSHVRPMMNRHGLYRTYVAQYEFCSDCTGGVRRVPARAVASVNTHDMPPFAAFWQGLDISHRNELGLLDEAGARQEREARQAIRRSVLGLSHSPRANANPSLDCRAGLEAVLSSLSRSKAHIVVVNLEDLWAETESQNIPGTKSEHPNWRRKMRHPLEEIRTMPQVEQVLRKVDRVRREGRK